MKIILLFAATLSIVGCSTPFDEYYRPNGAIIVERSAMPSLAQVPVVEPVTPKTDEEKEVKTFPIDLGSN